MNMEQKSQEQSPLGDLVLDRIVEESQRREVREAASELSALLERSNVQELLKGVTMRYHNQDMRVVEVFGGVMVELQDERGNVLFVPSSKLVQ